MSILHKKGYILNKNEFDIKLLNEIKEDLTVHPKNNYLNDKSAVKNFTVFNESKKYLYIPKYYGLLKVGKPLQYLENEGEESTMTFNSDLKDYQLPCVEKVIASCKTQGGGLVCVPCGFGKCLGYNTKILMYSNKIKYVQNVKVGDKLMGDDNKERNVLSICSGKEMLYKIHTPTGDDYIVNESHILTVIINNNICDIRLKYAYSLIQNGINLCGYQVILTFNNNIECTYSELKEYILNLTNGNILDKYKYNSIENRTILVNLYIQYFSILNIECELLLNDIIFICRSIGKYPIIQNNELIFVTNNLLQITKLEIDDYYGFEIDGNKRFLLGDCSVTHNTVVSLYIACALKAKTLVIVHKEFLVHQWKERIEQFTNAKIGTIQGKKVDIEGKDIVIGMLQSISQKKYDPEIYKQFRFVIVDECHHASAECFSQALPLISTKYQLGLTATPTRKDGLTKVFKWYLGDIIYSVNRKSNSDVLVERYLCTSEKDNYKEKINRVGKPCIASMINNVAEYHQRNLFIVDILKRLISEKRHILVLSERRGHLTELKKLLSDKLSFEAGLYVGGMKSHDLDLSCEKDVILATYQMASEAFDCKKLETLVMVTSKSDIVQSVGRILRKEHTEPKALIVDMSDMFSIFQNQARKRLAYYNQNKYSVTSYNVNECVLES